MSLENRKKWRDFNATEPLIILKILGDLNQDQLVSSVSEVSGSPSKEINLTKRKIKTVTWS